MSLEKTFWKVKAKDNNYLKSKSSVTVEFILEATEYDKERIIEIIKETYEGLEIIELEQLNYNPLNMFIKD